MSELSETQPRCPTCYQLMPKKKFPIRRAELVHLANNPGMWSGVTRHEDWRSRCLDLAEAERQGLIRQMSSGGFEITDAGRKALEDTRP